MTPSGTAPDQARSKRSVSWVIGIGAAAMVAIALVLMFLLTQATDNHGLYEQNYANLMVINTVVAALLLLVIVWIAWRLLWRLRRGKFGSRLLIKLAAIFALLGFLPGALIYVVSYQFVSRSIESWFDVKVEGALDAGLNLGRTTLDTLSNDLTAKARVAADQLGSASDAGAAVALERLREQLAASDVVLWSSAGQVIASAGDSRFRLQPERPSLAQFRQARSQRVVTQIEGLEEGVGSKVAKMRALAVVGASGIGLLTEPRYLQIVQVLPVSLVTNALAVQDAYKEYQERALARSGLRKMYIGTLTLSLFLAVFGAVLLSVLLGNQIVRPLLVLADGVAQVAAGDLRPKAALQTRDELGGLTRSFADMTQQLFDARSQVQRSMEQVDASRANVQTILDNLTAGVIVFDAQGHMLSCNPGATRILRAPLAVYDGKPLQQVPGLEAFAQGVGEQFDAFLNDRSSHDVGHWQHSFELAYQNNAAIVADLKAPGLANTISIIARGAELPQQQRLLVFDDISEVVSAQRAQAWGEVARRLAHEIKNPLTPIQLSAERLEMKLQGKLAEPDQAMLTKSVKTIVDQVDAMKRLVNEFRDYARLPSADLQPLDLNGLITDVLQLYAPDTTQVPVTSSLARDNPMILGDAQQLRQVIHNLLQNAQDATAARMQAATIEAAAPAPPSPSAQVIITTQYNAESRRVRMTVSDSGTGFAPHILQRAFEPYVTTKVRGTGLGLAVVKKIADEHGARIELSNRSASAEPEGQTPADGAGESTNKIILGAQVILSFAVV
jgi:nitrogen fixation/metabolism regulation signal transduction histidine kinase